MRYHPKRIIEYLRKLSPGQWRYEHKPADGYHWQRADGVKAKIVRFLTYTNEIIVVHPRQSDEFDDSGYSYLYCWSRIRTNDLDYA